MCFLCRMWKLVLLTENFLCQSSVAFGFTQFVSHCSSVPFFPIGYTHTAAHTPKHEETYKQSRTACNSACQFAMTASLVPAEWWETELRMDVCAVGFPGLVTRNSVVTCKSMFEPSNNSLGQWASTEDVQQKRIQGGLSCQQVVSIHSGLREKKQFIYSSNPNSF